MVLTPEPGLGPEVGVASRLPENFLRPDLALGSRHVMNINCSLKSGVAFLIGNTCFYPEAASPLGRPCQLGKTEKKQTMQCRSCFGHYTLNCFLVTVKGSGLLCVAEWEILRAELICERGSSTSGWQPA